MKIRNGFSIVLSCIAACGVATDGVEEESAPLLGPSTIDYATCEPQYRHLLERSLSMGRSAALTLAFEQCLDRGIRGRTEYDGYIIGPYLPCTRDPYATDPVSSQVSHALAFARGSNALEYNCARGDASWGASAYVVDVGSSTESLTFNMTALDQYLAGANPASWTPYGYVASGFWHEAMHNHLYEHGAQGSDCGQGETYQMDINSMPYIVGRCIEQVFKESAKRCGSMDQCGVDAVRLVNGIDGSTCSCVLDPTPPSRPSVTATEKPGLVRISWPKIANATSYRISSSVDGKTFQWSWTSHWCDATTCYSDDYQTWGNLYYAVVAIDRAGESARSNLVRGRGWVNVSHDPRATASQSSTYPDHSEAWRAIDGNYDGNWNSGSVTSTGWGWNESWQIYLWQVRNLKQIDLYCRTDWGCDYLQQFDVYGKNPCWLGGCSTTWKLLATQQSWAGAKTTLSLSGSYSYLLVKLRQRTDLGTPPPGAALMLAEVDVWGN